MEDCKKIEARTLSIETDLYNIEKDLNNTIENLVFQENRLLFLLENINILEKKALIVSLSQYRTVRSDIVLTLDAIKKIKNRIETLKQLLEKKAIALDYYYAEMDRTGSHDDTTILRFERTITRTTKSDKEKNNRR